MSFRNIFETSLSQTKVSQDVIFLADLFVEDLRGGAELTSEAILKASPLSVYKFKPSSKPNLNEQVSFVKENASKIWVVGNFSSMHPQALTQLQIQGSKYFVIEYDYKYCNFRSPQLHKMQTGVDCDCHRQKIGQWIGNFYAGARHVFFMSEKQREFYLSRFPFLKNNSSVQSSTWEPQHLGRLFELSKTPKSNKWAILGGASWLKATEQTVAYAKKNNLEYEVIGGMPYENFIEKLSTFKGLLFLPIGFDTCPRIVVEAQMMGLELKTNDFVQHIGEEWTKLNGDDLKENLSKRPEVFWKNLRIVLEGGKIDNNGK